MTDEVALPKEVSNKIMEMDKGLTSSNLGEQCRSIADYPDFIKIYPFPIVINSTFIKIADAFLSGSNFLRSCILRSCADCRTQLFRLTIADDIVGKLTPLYKSDDPNCRALYLSLLGVLSGIFKDNVSIHNFIISRLDSPFESESSVAITTAKSFAAISKEFVINLCPVLLDLLKVNSISPDLKLNLIPLAEYAYHDPVLLPEIRGCLIDLLKSHTVTSFVIIICNTLTKMEIHSPLNTFSQLDLLLEHIKASPDREVRRSLLSCLMSLANKLPNQWSPSHAAQLCAVFSDSATMNEEREIILIIFFLLTSSVNSNLLFGDCKRANSDVLACLMQALSCETSPGSSLLPNALAFACKLVRGGKIADDFNPEIVASMLVTSLTQPCEFNDRSDRPNSSWLISESGPPIHSLKLFYFELLMFFETFPNFVTLLNRIELLKEVRMTGDPRITLLCQFLSRVCTIDLLQLPELPELLSQLRNSCDPHSADINCDNLLQVCVFVFTAVNGTALSKEQQLDLLTSLAHALNCTSNDGGPKALEPWIVYQLACKASVYRQPRFAADLFEQLASLAITLKNIYWLRGLAKLNRAQANLYDCVSDLVQTERWVPRLSAAISTASKEITEAQYLLTAAGGRSLHVFQTMYASIRADLLTCLVRLCDKAFELGAFTSSGVPTRWQRLRKMNASKEEGESSSKITPLKLMGSLLPIWKDLEAKVLTLIQSCVDADLSTLRHLNTILEIIHIFTETLEECRTFRGDWKNPACIDKKNLFSTSSHEGFEATPTVLRDYLTNNPLSPQLLVNMVTLLVSLPPPCLPTFFFTRKQVTKIDLYIISPANENDSNNSGNTFQLPLGTSLALEVMGIVEQKRPVSNSKLLRAVVGVCLIITLQRKNKREILARKLVSIREDSFAAEFCLNLPTKAETCQLTVEVILVDEQRRRWRLGDEAGATKTLIIKLENMAGSSNVGDPHKLISDFDVPLAAQMEDVLMKSLPS
ncbi:hypothetical protein Aperf_G00000033701 [Anoplocephala perfoliata]